MLKSDCRALGPFAVVVNFNYYILVKTAYT